MEANKTRTNSSISLLTKLAAYISGASSAVIIRPNLDDWPPENTKPTQLSFELRSSHGLELGSLVLEVNRNELSDLQLNLLSEISNQISEYLDAELNPIDTKYISNSRLHHEIKAPLTLMIGVAELLTQSNLTSEQSSWVRKLSQAGDSLHLLIEEALGQKKKAESPRSMALADPERPGTHFERKFTILIVDDSEDIQELVKAYLKNEPYVLESAYNGSDALDKLTTKKYDLILMDMQMPVMDGITTVKRYREWELQHDLFKTPIISLTACSLEEEKSAMIRAGSNLHLMKPIKKVVLIGSIEKYLKKVS